MLLLQLLGEQTHVFTLARLVGVGGLTPQTGSLSIHQKWRAAGLKALCVSLYALFCGTCRCTKWYGGHGPESCILHSFNSSVADEYLF